jgi:hypothetical protein
MSAAEAADAAPMKTATNTAKLRKMNLPCQVDHDGSKRRLRNQGMHSVAFCRRTSDLSGRMAGKFSRGLFGRHNSWGQEGAATLRAQASRIHLGERRRRTAIV